MVWEKHGFSKKLKTSQKVNVRKKVKVSQSYWLFATCGLYSPWNSPGQNTGVGSLSFFQGIEPRPPALQADSLPAEPSGKPKTRIQITVPPLTRCVTWGKFMVLCFSSFICRTRLLSNWDCSRRDDIHETLSQHWDRHRMWAQATKSHFHAVKHSTFISVTCIFHF